MEKIKQFLESDRGEHILVIFIIILVGLSSFELGRLSKEKAHSGLKIEYPKALEAQKASVISSKTDTKVINTTQKAEIQKTSIATNSAKIKFFASSRGNKYYSIGCSAGKTIKKENRVYFTTKEDAEQAGYELSGSCK